MLEIICQMGPFDHKKKLVSLCCHATKNWPWILKKIISWKYFSRWPTPWKWSVCGHLWSLFLTNKIWNYATILWKNLTQFPRLKEFDDRFSPCFSAADTKYLHIKLHMIACPIILGSDQFWPKTRYTASKQELLRVRWSAAHLDQHVGQPRKSCPFIHCPHYFKQYLFLNWKAFVQVKALKSMPDFPQLQGAFFPILWILLFEN